MSKKIVSCSGDFCGETIEIDDIMYSPKEYANVISANRWATVRNIWAYCPDCFDLLPSKDGSK